MRERPLRSEPARPGGGLLADRYRLERVIGSGGSAVVWQARDTQLDRPVAIKLLHPHLVPDERSRLRIEAEARVAAVLSHPAIIPVQDVVVDDSRVGIVLDLIDGEPLGDRIVRAGPLPARLAAEVAATIADALAHAHATGIVHRDVKPDNVLVGPSGQAWLVDFGIATALDEAGGGLTVTGSVMGTLRYMAPEQLAGVPATQATDLYGLGSVLYEMLTGVPPFAAASPAALIRQQQYAPPRLEAVPSPLVPLIESCLAADPARRPAGAGTVATALRDWLRHPEAVPAAPASPARLLRGARARLAARRWPALAGATASLVLGAAVLAAIADPLGWGRPEDGTGFVPPAGALDAVEPGEEVNPVPPSAPVDAGAEPADEVGTGAEPPLAELPAGPEAPPAAPDPARPPGRDAATGSDGDGRGRGHGQRGRSGEAQSREREDRATDRRHSPDRRAGDRDRDGGKPDRGGRGGGNRGGR